MINKELNFSGKIIISKEEDDATINNIGICLKGVGNLNGALEHYKKARRINRLYSKNIEKLEEKMSK